MCQGRIRVMKVPDSWLLDPSLGIGGAVDPLTTLIPVHNYLMVNAGSLLVWFCNNSPDSFSLASRWNNWGKPPPNPLEQDTERLVVVWLWTSQSLGRSGGPEKKIWRIWLDIIFWKIKFSIYPIFVQDNPIADNKYF